MSISEKSVLEAIKSRGYWEIELRPTKYCEDYFSLSKCKELIEKNQVRLRGWDYPHAGHNHGDFFNGKNFVESYVDWSEHHEIFRLYQSGQFIHYLNFWEDWISYDPYGYDVILTNGEQRFNVKGILMTLYTITEIFIFASRLASSGIGDKAMHVSIKLKDTSNRRLFFEDNLRQVHGDYVCKIPEFDIIRDISLDSIIANYADLSFKTTIDVFERFNWTISEETKDILKKDQEKFLSRT